MYMSVVTSSMKGIIQTLQDVFYRCIVDVRLICNRTTTIRPANFIRPIFTGFGACERRAASTRTTTTTPLHAASHIFDARHDTAITTTPNSPRDHVASP
jgi:hypothetical protein